MTRLVKTSTNRKIPCTTRLHALAAIPARLIERGLRKEAALRTGNNYPHAEPSISRALGARAMATSPPPTGSART